MIILKPRRGIEYRDSDVRTGRLYLLKLRDKNGDLKLGRDHLGDYDACFLLSKYGETDVVMAPVAYAI